MYYGIESYSKKPKLNDKLFREIIDLYSEKFGIKINNFEFLRKGTDKSKKVRNLDKAYQLILSNNHSSVTAYDKSEESNQFSIDLSVIQDNYFLPVEIDMMFYNKSLDYGSIVKIVDTFINIVEPYYAFFAYNNTCNFLMEELSFIPMSDSWLTGDKNEKREKYLFNLQDLRCDFGKIIPQLYPVNYFSKEMIDVVNKVKPKLNDNWIIDENNDYIIIRYKKFLPWRKFAKISDKISLEF